MLKVEAIFTIPLGPKLVLSPALWWWLYLLLDYLPIQLVALRHFVRLSRGFTAALIVVGRYLKTRNREVIKEDKTNHSIMDRGPRNEPSRLEGFPSLAHFIGEDNDAAIFRTFNELGARNLLYLQSNLNELEIQLKRLDHEDAKNGPGNPGLRISAREYRSLKAAADRYHTNEADEALDTYAARNGTSSHLENNNTRLENGSKDDKCKYFNDRLELHNKIKDAMRDYRKSNSNP